MRKQDPYCYPETSALKNKFNIREVSLLEKAEADLSRAKMSILYKSPVDKFDAQSFLRVHEFLFEEVYDWAGRLRTISISKPEEVLGGKSVWYEDALDLPESLDRALYSYSSYCMAHDKESRGRTIALATGWLFLPIRNLLGLFRRI